ncbi:MAG TPA: GTPase Era [Bacteroidota bacterium]|nr:GTPase Era [Bacteroidota bacterium]
MTGSLPFKAGYVAIVGEPNVGKSTLMNALLEQKISIVTRKPQTTRQRVLGIATDEESQMIFLDTPGLLEPRYLLHEKMLLVARRALEDADVLLILTEPSQGMELPDQVKAQVLSKQWSKPLVLGINKADTVARETLLPLIEHFSGMKHFRDIVPISALKGENLATLRQVLKKSLPEHAPFYPEEFVSEQPERFFASELIREAIFEQFQEEIPYSTAVEIREFKEREEGKTYINADIVVERDSQKGILIGKKGAALKRIGQTARIRIEQFIQRPVFLDLHVKVGEGWRSKESWMKRLGFE